MRKQQQKCCQCLGIFTTENPPHQMPTCQHNICNKCLKQAILSKQQFIQCGFCMKMTNKKDIQLFPKNMKIIENFKVNCTALQIISNQEKYSQAFIGAKSYSLKQDQELLIATETSQFQPNVREQQKICQLHQKPLDILCVTEKIQVCPHCALFGDHKEHKFKTLIEFDSEIKQKAQIFYQVVNLKRKKQSQNDLQNLRSKLTSKILYRKDLLMKEIDKNFKELMETIVKARKSIQSQLSQKFNQAKTIMNKELDQQLKYNISYLQWKNDCEQAVKQLKNTTIYQKKISIYFNSKLQNIENQKLFIDQMMDKLLQLSKLIDQKINRISIKVQDIKIEKYITLCFPLLEETNLSKSFISQVSNNSRPLIINKSLNEVIKPKNQERGQKSSRSILLQEENVKSKEVNSSFYEDSFRNSRFQTTEDFEDNPFIFDGDVSCIIKFKENNVNDHKSPTEKISKNSKVLDETQKSCMPTSPRTSSFASRLGISKINKIKPKDQINQPKTSAMKRVSSPNFAKVKKQKQLKTPQEVLTSLLSNDFINEVDLSEMSMSDQDILEFLRKAQKIRPLKAIKLQENSLTDEGFEKICQYLEHVSNLNLSFNKLTEKSLQIILKNKQYLYKLRIINLCNNKMTMDRMDNKIRGKLEQLKKMGILVNL